MDRTTLPKTQLLLRLCNLCLIVLIARGQVWIGRISPPVGTLWKFLIAYCNKESFIIFFDIDREDRKKWYRYARRGVGNSLVTTFLRSIVLHSVLC